MIGVLVNPVAGVGGSAGLSGSDGADIQQLALNLGAKPRATSRMVLALGELAARQPGLTVLTAGGSMGEDAVREAGLEATVVYRAACDRATAAETAVPGATAPGATAPEATAQETTAPETTAVTTTAADTRAAVAALVEGGATLVLFAGGDGTARDVAAALSNLALAHPDVITSTGAETVAALGVPSGVKMYSGVFAVAPRAAGSTAAAWIDGTVPTILRDVLDIDEEALRVERVAARLFGSMRVPVIAGRTQARKSSTLAGEHQAILAAARGAVNQLDEHGTYAIGPGGTMQEVARLLGYAKGPLGVDIVRPADLAAALAAGEAPEPLMRNASEREIARFARRGGLKLVVSIIGGQGFVLGRGNQQLGREVLSKLEPGDLIVVAPDQKLIDLRGQPLLIDTGDDEIDTRFTGIVRVVTGVATHSLYRMRASDREEAHAS